MNVQIQACATLDIKGNQTLKRTMSFQECLCLQQKLNNPNHEMPNTYGYSIYCKFRCRVYIKMN